MVHWLEDLEDYRVFGYCESTNDPTVFLFHGFKTLNKKHSVSQCKIYLIIIIIPVIIVSYVNIMLSLFHSHNYI